MLASDIMTAPVITAAPRTDMLEVVRLMLENRISALPIVADDGTLVGLVSEGDLIRRSELGAPEYSSWWLAAIGGQVRLAEEFVKTHAMKAEEIMTREVITVPPDMSAWKIAEILERKKIKRVPVVKDGTVVGIVSRANLLQALAAQRENMGQTPTGDDRVLRQKVLDSLEGENWPDLAHLNVVVVDGVVHYWGLAQSAAVRQALKVAAESVPGVRDVVDHTHTSVTLI